jgi:putative transposase
VADLTYVAVIMDAWSRRIIGYAMSRRIDARLTLAALDAAIALRHPPPGFGPGEGAVSRTVRG